MTYLIYYRFAEFELWQNFVFDDQLWLFFFLRQDNYEFLVILMTL